MYISTPQNTHCVQVVKTVEAGKGILCEKPIAISQEEVDEECSRSSIKFMLGFCMRYNVYYKKVRELVQSGAIDRIVMGRAELTCWYLPTTDVWRQDFSISHGGTLIDMGNYCLDILEWIIDVEIIEVAGFQD